MAQSIDYLTLGIDNADIEIESYINIGCPFCTRYIKAVDDLFQKYIDDGKVKHVIKHVDRTNGPLLKGTVANTYLDTNRPEETYDTIRHLLNTRPEWTESFEDTLRKVEGELGLREYDDTGERSKAILDEAADRGVRVVPTVFINRDKFEFPVKGEPEEITEAFTNELGRLS